MSTLARDLEQLNDHYLELHQRKESAFWLTRMGIEDRGVELSRTDLELKAWLGDPARLAELRRWKASGQASAAQDVVLDGWILMFERNQVEDPQAVALLEELVVAEEELQRRRGRMELGFVLPDGAVERASSVALSNAVRTHGDSDRRRAAFEGLRSIETFALANGFAEVLKLRNRFARKLGYVDFYDYKTQWAEGFDKQTLFGYLDDLERRTREPARRSLEALRARLGDEALEPWNFQFHTGGGDLQKEKDAYFRFEDAPERWVRSFAALGIRFRNARITLDLVDRAGKYENGFMHGPVPAFHRRGEWLPAEINFTANALPGSIGAGVRAAQTLFHEGGHAAHFANVDMDAPCFSQEFAPTSVALAETQSMFCDRLLSDADWQTRYAVDAEGTPYPFDLMEREIRETQPFAAQAVRNMLVVCYSEKALYEMSDDELTPDAVLRVLREVETRLTLLPGGCPRPTLAVPHLLSRESSAYYHGYVLAEMAVHQTRAHFFRRYGYLVDNPAIGRDLAATYWAPGNSRSFLDLVQELTGSPFSADAIVAHVSRSADEAVAGAAERIRRLPTIPQYEGDADLDLRLSVIHGAEKVVGESRNALEAAGAFRCWIRETWPPADAGATA